MSAVSTGSMALRGVLSAATEVVPEALLAGQRVQLSVRGRRFEMAAPVAAAYCLSVFYFFSLPMETARWTPEECSALVGDSADAGALTPLTLVQRLGGGAGEGSVAAALGAVLRRHFALCAQPTVEADLRGERLRDAIGGYGGSWDLLPAAVVLPETVEWRPAESLWVVAFARRLPGGAPPTPAATEEDPSNNPFALLQADYVGVVVVYLRRLHAAETRGGAAPSFPVRWAELSLDQQVALGQVVRALGVVPLLSSFLLPTAPASTSLYVGPAAAKRREEAAAAGTAASLVERARRFAAESTLAGAAVADGGDDDDDGLPPPALGCSRCGTATHMDADCPH